MISINMTDTSGQPGCLDDAPEPLRPEPAARPERDRGAIDLLVMPQQYAERLDHAHEQLFRDSRVCLAWNGHPLANRRMTLDEYMALEHVTVRFGDERSVSFEEWFLPRYGQQHRVSCSVDSFSALPLLLLGTERMETVHRRLATHSARVLPLKLLELPFEIPPLQEVLAWPRDPQAEPAHTWLREQIRSCAGELREPLKGAASQNNV